MTWDELYTQIQKGDVQPVYFFYGVEERVKQTALERLRARLLPEGLEVLNETVFDGPASARQLIEAAQTLPLMCEKRLVVARDWPALMPGTARGEGEDVPEMLSFLERAPDTCCVVFYVRGTPDLRKKLPAALEKRGAGVKFDLLSDAELNKWVNSYLKQARKRMDRAAVNQLVFMAGRALTGLAGELDKLIAFVGERETIQVEDVESIVTPTLECTVFQMIDSLMAGDAARAHQRYLAMLENGESRVGILAMLTRQTRNLTHIKRLRDRGVALREIEKLMELNHYAAQQAERQSARIPQEAAEAAYRACAQAEFDIKNGALREEAAVDALMLRLTRLRGA